MIGPPATLPQARPAGAVLLAVLAVAAAGAATTAGGACARQVRAYGEPVDAGRAIPVSQALAVAAGAGPETPAAPIVVTGRVAEVCRTAGCWLVLREVHGDRTLDLHVDLAAGADFTVPTSLVGRRVAVAGRLAGQPPDTQLRAVGLVVMDGE